MMHRSSVSSLRNIIWGSLDGSECMSILQVSFESCDLCFIKELSVRSFPLRSSDFNLVWRGSAYLEMVVRRS